MTGIGSAPVAAAFAGPAPQPVPADAGRKVLHLAFSSSESGLDPAKVVDLYSRTVTPHIFEALYKYDHLARPVKIKPNLAEAMPEVSPDFRVWTVKVRRGIFFADDPVFNGVKRELVAEDFVYAMKRFYDPANKSPAIGTLLGYGFVGMKALRDDATERKKPFDYDRPVEGLRALDRYTVRFVTEQPRPRLLELLATPDLWGAVAREVVEFYGNEIDAHPVGTGPFRLKQWRRASLIVLERNPHYRDERWDAEPAPDDAEGQAILARLKGRKLPLVDEVQISIILESQPRWLTFLNGRIDALATNSNPLPQEFVGVAMPNGKLAPNLAKRGILGRQNVNADVHLTMFNMEHALVGGYTPEKVALRRAISLGYDVRREIDAFWKGAAVPAQSALVPYTVGYDAAFKCESSDYDPARAKALLDMYGYVDRDGDGWREQPDGSPLLLEMMTQPEQRSRILDELWQKAMNALGLRIKFIVGQWPENLKAARNGKYMVWQFGLSAAAPDGETAVARYVTSEIGSQNYARFRLPAMDRIYERLQALPDGQERRALFDEVKRIGAAYMPLKHRVHRMECELRHPWLVGYKKPIFWQDWWHMVDIDDSKRPAR
ncbi:bicyclomycin resistance protein [Aquincola sp. S2]|uniref:Bicyclomycin resistance protein n=2 Tax=Pseudaquabacterium terrae TaxID=2732868 RepID=A0ABX2EKT8_9BURK|nr:ABC transporter substrate-binding protein [Aquabacterium terrae]NRF69257.1 bicyclomycin resistance protein [Aquabacterium terrae]